MTTIKISIIAIALFSLNACNTNLDDVMLADDITALQAMQTSYIAAVESNSSLANYIESTGITNDQTCFSLDSTYHQNDSIFEANHMMYSHNSSGDDHDSNSWMMGSGWMSGNSGQMGSGGMMGGSGSQMGYGFNANFCTANNLDLMDSLMNVHDDYHPGNTNLSADDVDALQAMETAYLAAVGYNDSLATYIDTTGITNDATCFNFDEMYHHNDSIFEANHKMYSHNNSGDDHGSNDWSMDSGWMSGSGGMMGNGSNSSGGMMGTGFNSSNCNSNNLDLMDSLMIVHDNYHPGN
jgi:hypothetical protein